MIGKQATITGYPSEQPKSTQYTASGEIRKNYSTIKYYIYTTGGTSGAPVFAEIDGTTYVVGVHSYLYINFGGAARISEFLFDFLNYFLIENNRGLELRDYYYEGVTKHKYNTMVEMIISPRENLDVYLSTDNSIYVSTPSEVTKTFHTSSNSSTNASFSYSYFKNYDRTTSTFSSVYSFSSYFNSDLRTAQYKIVNKSTNGAIIYTSFDKSSNEWSHGGSRGEYIKGTIAYNGFARNIEVKIPLLGTNTSDAVTIEGVTFYLRTGPNKVSLKASQQITCSNATIFAFGVD